MKEGKELNENRKRKETTENEERNKEYRSTSVELIQSMRLEQVQCITELAIKFLR